MKELHIIQKYERLSEKVGKLIQLFALGEKVAPQHVQQLLNNFRELPSIDRESVGTNNLHLLRLQSRIQDLKSLLQSDRKQ